MRNLNEMDLSELKAKLDSLATAKECPVVYVENGNKPIAMPDFKAIINEKTGEVETVASKGYVTIQHKDAFGAVLDAVAAASKGAKFRASVMEQGGRAWMTVVFSQITADDGLNGIELGINVRNSFDKTSALKYSGSTKENKEGHFEFFGYRLACMNGMTVKVELGDISKLNVVPKARAKVGDIVEVRKEAVFDPRKAEVEAVKATIRHFGKNTKMDLERVAEMIMALPLVARRLEEQIKAVQKVSYTTDEANARLTEVGFGDRLREKIMERYKSEEQTAWGLYNATTAYATHDEKVSPLAMERTYKRAALIMEARA
jgi:hypothetical protein